MLLSAYFSGSETALMSINRYRLKHLAQKGHGPAQKVARLLSRPDRLLGVILLGNNLVNILAASLGTVVAIRLFGDWGPVIATVVLTMVFLIFAEVTPKTIAAHFSERVAFVSVYALEPLLKLMYPLVVTINVISNFIARLFSADLQSPQSTESLSNEELRTLVHEDAAITDKGKAMMLSVIDLEQVTVNDVMVPKSEITSIDIEQDIPSIVEQICHSSYTRLPVVKGDINHVIGILHLRQAGPFLTATETTKSKLLQAVAEPFYIPEGTSLQRQLINFQKTQNRIGLVVDEYGIVLGIVTIGDILEEIVGEFTTDVASNISEIHPQADGAYLIDGTAHLRHINHALSWKLPLDGPKTLSGLIIEYLEIIPENNICVSAYAYRFETVQISGNMVRVAKVSPVPEPKVANT